MPFHLLQPLPGGATLGLWHLTEAPADLWPQLADAPTYAPLLPARADGPRQAQWLAGRLLVQHLLRTAAPGQPLPLLHNDTHGRPFLVGTGSVAAVSLSHSGNWVAALLAPPGAAVGVDVELVRDKAQRIARKFLNNPELAAVEQLTAPSAVSPTLAPELYSLLWSAKETLFKLANRRGIIFRDNLLLDLPPGPWPAAGELPATLQLTGCNSRHQICYLRPAAGYVLTYCYQIAL
ncbi:4'-phosphopantetheinyl transferase superfamily protein [Hymenobacter sp. HMF4947]|uniref:4'-phosphopantetheinyl transferase superfamily protein n=1 Tax=Hymenobacter ginkgonis TaxID=2682976 RepID=A0A7K1TG40_9BACT|nr:4'-phosphopantetheinyl transferase superfamily protein [Hymenobacter ginkgonis]MVN77363.1 4'-phosphopantetheinyl transferase superfamily protein [Hymenobacter ginkgonis]